MTDKESREDISKSETEQREYNILIYGIEKKKLVAPTAEVRDRNYRLSFESFTTHSRFSDYDGVILFQGIFESIEYKSDYYGDSYIDHHYDKDELDKRLNEAKILLKNKGFICFILCDKFVDSSNGEDYQCTDLTKYFLMLYSFHRYNFGERIAGMTLGG